MARVQRPLVWIGSSLEDLRAFPEAVRDDVGFAIYQIQCGEKPVCAKPLRGFHGATMLEITEDHDTDTYRAVCTVRFQDAVYVLHCFQKKSKSGIATPRQDIDLIRQRLKVAELEHKRWRESQE